MSTCYYYPFSQLGKKNNSSSDIKLIEQFNKDPNSAIAASVNVMQQKSTEESPAQSHPQSPAQSHPQSHAQSSELELPIESQESQEREKSQEPEDSINKPTELITTPASILTISNPNKFSGLIFLCLFAILLVLIFRTR